MDIAMIHNTNQFVHTVIDGEDIAKKLLHNARLVSQRAYKGNAGKNIAAGTTVTLQITEDATGGYTDKATGELLDNTLETVDVTIVGCDYPLPIKKGDYCDVSGFIPELSYYIDYNLILRYSEIHKTTPPNRSQPQNGDK